MANPIVAPLPTTPIVAPDLTPIGAFPISDMDKAQLAAGKTIVLSFHTPRMLHQTMGARNFTITLTQDLSGNVICADAASVTRGINHIAEVVNAISVFNSNIKNVKPDPNV